MTGHPSFQAHVALLHTFLAGRDAIVERIQTLLNAQRKPSEYLQDRARLSVHIEDCFFAQPEFAQPDARLRGELDAAHTASRLRPRELPGLYNGPADPAEMMVRGFHVWQQTRWPGRGGRVRYAHTLFNLYVLRSLELLSVRLWDDGSDGVTGRLEQLQGALDSLWRTTPADHPRLVRDARWLLPLAQSPATDDLGIYFEIAERVADTFSEPDRLEVHTAGVRMSAGHLRSQLRYYGMKRGVPLGDESVTRITRTTNALDFALLVQELVPLLDAYATASQRGDEPRRLELADTICQAISPDPELFLNRVDLLGAYSMIQPLFVTTDLHERAILTPMGRRHARLLREYGEGIGRVSAQLLHDCRQFRPADAAYSPYGALYGFSSNLIEHMALKTLEADAVSRFGLEDVFVSGDADKLAWVTGWRQLPHLSRETTAPFDYPRQFAVDVFDRLEEALRRRVVAGPDAGPCGSLHIFSETQAADSAASALPDLPDAYVRSSDPQRVSAHKAVHQSESQLVSDRHEGRSLISDKSPLGWIAISKDVLTDILGAGRDVKVVGLPAGTTRLLALMYPNLVVASENATRH